MHVANNLYPNEAQIAGFAEPGPDGPIVMVNLLKFRDRAQYPDGHHSDLSGEQAYQLYGQAVSELLREVGGSMAFSADVARLTIGEVEDLWDKIAIAVYPSRAAMLAMMQSPRMQEIAVHRAAGLEGQLNIEATGAAGAWLTGAAGS